jgi:hypothetical protein
VQDNILPLAYGEDEEVRTLYSDSNGMPDYMPCAMRKLESDATLLQHEWWKFAEGEKVSRQSDITSPQK